MNRFWIVGNWKMNASKVMLEALVAELKAGLPAGVPQNGVTVAICPPAPYLPLAVAATAQSPIAVGAQNVHPEPKGAFTGEIAPNMLTDLGVAYGIVGHSERRQMFGDTDAFVRAKLLALLEEGVSPIVCVGETLEEREAGQHEAIVSGQVKAALEGLSEAQMQQVVVAYEPVWAIGTGKTASPEQAESMHQTIRQVLEQLAPRQANAVPLLYGGSVNAANAAELLGQPNINGALVGGASLKAPDFLTIVQAACDQAQ